MEKSRIFIVEDEGIVAKDIQKCLENSGYSVLGIVDTGEEAQKQAERLKPDLILMDIMLKGEIDGIEAARYIHDYLNIPVVYLTAHSDQSILIKAKITEPFGYIIKPFSERELRSSIEMALHKHKMEQKFRENYQRLDSTLKSIGEAVIATDVHGCITFINSIAQNLTGLSEHEVLGKSLTEVLSIADEKCEPLNPVLSALERGKTFDFFTRHITLTTHDGKELKITGSYAPVFEEDNNPAGSILIFCDITHLYKTAEDLYRTYKLDSMSNLVDSVVSDCNDIISQIMKSINQAKLHLDPGNNIVEQLQETENACCRVNSLTENLLTLTETGTITKEMVSLPELFSHVVSDTVGDLSIGFSFSFKEDLWKVEVDKKLMKQVVTHIINNALEAMSESGGKIEIMAENTTVDPHQLPFLQKGRYVKVLIKDRGCGIPKKHILKVFDPLFTTKPQREGLGLALAYSLVKKHKGTISIESTPGTGTTVSLYIPASLS